MEDQGYSASTSKVNAVHRRNNRVLLPCDLQLGLINRGFDVPGIAIPRWSTQRQMEPIHWVPS